MCPGNVKIYDIYKTEFEYTGGLFMERIMTPGKRIGILCKEHGVSKKELADRIGVSPSQISRIVREDTKTINSDILIALALEFGVSTDYILGIDQKKTETPVEKYAPMLVMNTAFKPGTCLEFIESLKDPDIKKMAYAEYYYFSGQHEKAVEITELYLSCENQMMQLSACLIYSFANLSLNHINSARLGLNSLEQNLELYAQKNKENRALIVFMAGAARVLLHLPVEDTQKLAGSIVELPGGMKLWGCYVMAHEAYLTQEYEKSLGIVDACLSLSSNMYPIAMIYLHLMAAMDAMNLRKPELAKQHFMKAWELAEPDDLIEGIGEHHGLLQGLIETCMKDDYPEAYERIIGITYRFSYGWRRIHNPDTNEEVADNLTTTEFTIAMLANRGWTNSEIAEYMGVTERTVKQRLTDIFNKLSITNRKQLKNYMLR